MSRGGYTEAIDMWGCGCVLGELLQRVAWIGKATTPQLQVNCGAARTFWIQRPGSRLQPACQPATRLLVFCFESSSNRHTLRRISHVACHLYSVTATAAPPEAHKQSRKPHVDLACRNVPQPPDP